ncbi:S1 family peptidase [Acidicapsa ligni]|uniref:S1 family peptidase n=1 Tax=Acidicapsa ligni TaxID=542300 RepID=UPI0021DF5522|nr:S1 family peptidase [Acidicapsa ligni]
MRLNPLHASAVVLAPAILAVAGCGGHVSASGTDIAGATRVSIHAATTQVDTSRTTQYSATLSTGEPAKVEWSVTGGDPTAGAGSISANGLYTPPSYLTQDEANVTVSAVPAKQASQFSLTESTADLTVTPGFLQPLTPENLALGANGTVSISGSMTEVGGSASIHFALASDTAGTPSDAGTLSQPHCTRSSVSSANPAYTVCTVTYAAPATIATPVLVYVVGYVGSSPTKSATRSWTRVLLNSSGINSNPVGHQAHLAAPVQLGSSSGSNTDYDASLGSLSDCCGGTLGALLQDTSGNQYVLSNNHVLARSDQSLIGETIIQPGLIDNGCTPYGVGPGTTPIANLTGYPALTSPATNVDAAIARVASGAVDLKGSILELGTKQQDGSLAAAPLGISSTSGKGQAASLGMMVAKSGRTTGLTCASVSAMNVDVVVDYFTDCAETSHSMTKTFTNQIAISGTSFSDAGDSGALVVDTANAEPVGLFFAGGTDADGVEHAIANPVSDVLGALNSQVPGVAGQTSYSFVGGPDHPVSCLSYSSQKLSDDTSSSVTASYAKLGSIELERVEAALPLAQQLAQQSQGPSTGIVRVGPAASKDHPEEGAVAFYVEPGYVGTPPATIGGLPTLVIPNEAAAATPQPHAASLAQVLAVKQRNAATLLKSNPAIFGVGVGQSLDNPGDAAIVLFVDRKKVSSALPESVEGQRVRVILMDRLHVTRSHGTPSQSSGSCFSHQQKALPAENSYPDLLPDTIKLPN